MIIAAVAVVVLLVLGGVAALLISDEDEDKTKAQAKTERSAEPRADADSAAERTAQRAADRAAQRSSGRAGEGSTGRPSDRAVEAASGAVGSTIELPRSGVTLALPEGWVGASLEEGRDGAGTAMFPTDPTSARVVESRLGLLPASIVLFALDEEAFEAGADFVPNLNLLPDPTATPDVSVREAGRQQVRGLKVVASGAELISEDLVALDHQDAYRIVYRMNDFSAVAYVLVAEDQVWVLTYALGDDVEGQLPVVEASARTFRSG